MRRRFAGSSPALDAMPDIPEEQFKDVEFTPSEEKPGKCKHCGQSFGEHFKTAVKCHDTTKKLMTKGKYKRLEAKYDKPCRDAAKVIEEADEDNILKLTIKLDGGLQVLEAFEIEDREDMVKALKKEPV